MHITHLVLPRGFSIAVAEYQGDWQVALAPQGHTFTQYDLNPWFWSRILGLQFSETLLTSPLPLRVFSNVSQLLRQFSGKLGLNVDLLDGITLTKPDNASTGRMLTHALRSNLASLCAQLDTELSLSKTDIISLSVQNAGSMCWALALAHYVKTKYSQSRVIICTARDGLLLNRRPAQLQTSPIFKVIDGIVLYEEFAAEALVAFTQQPLQAIPNMVCRTKQGIVLTLPTEEQKKQLPPRRFVPIPKDYFSFGGDPSKLAYQMALCHSRCHYNKCTFCAQTAGRLGELTYSAEAEVNRSLQTVRQLNTLGITRVEFTDDALSVVLLREFVAGLHGKQIAWHGSFYDPQPVEATFARTLHQSGCTALSIGLETGSERIATLLGRMQPRAQLRDTVAKFSTAGISVGVEALYGVPTETPEEKRETLEFLQDLRTVSPHVTVNWMQWQLYRGSLVAREPNRFGVMHGLFPRFCDVYMQMNFKLAPTASNSPPVAPEGAKLVESSNEPPLSHQEPELALLDSSLHAAYQEAKKQAEPALQLALRMNKHLLGLLYYAVQQRTVLEAALSAKL